MNQPGTSRGGLQSVSYLPPPPPEGLKMMKDKTDEKVENDENSNMVVLRAQKPDSSGSSSDASDTSEDKAALKSAELNGEVPTATRKDIHLSRRLFHFLSGSLIATMYNLFLTHKQIVYILGTCASVLYLFEQVRISYPEIGRKLLILNRFLLRAEERLQESASVPYAMGLLLTILTFPKVPAVIGIYTLAIADPLAAICGIQYGRRVVAGHKTLEGSFAFFASTFACSLYVLVDAGDVGFGFALVASALIGGVVSLLELIPLKLDDNLTIPLSTAVIVWLVCMLFGFHLG